MSASASTPEFPGTCPSCGSPVVYRGVGRRPIWCSTRCRNDSALRRLGARKGAIEVRIVEVVRTPQSTPDTEQNSMAVDVGKRSPAPTIDQALHAIRNDAEAIGRLLSHLSRRQLNGNLSTPEWMPVRNGIRLVARDLGPDLERPN